jgi:hypothetical protein
MRNAWNHYCSFRLYRQATTYIILRDPNGCFIAATHGARLGRKFTLPVRKLAFSNGFGASPSAPVFISSDDDNAADYCAFGRSAVRPARQPDGSRLPRRHVWAGTCLVE